LANYGKSSEKVIKLISFVTDQNVGPLLMNRTLNSAISNNYPPEVVNEMRENLNLATQDSFFMREPCFNLDKYEFFRQYGYSAIKVLVGQFAQYEKMAETPYIGDETEIDSEELD
jgi:oligoribonuclease (3'-5' exoribonuclease)